MTSNFNQPWPLSFVFRLRISDKVCAAVVSKALNGKTTAVARATEALLSLVELEQGEKVMVRMRTICCFYLEDRGT